MESFIAENVVPVGRVKVDSFCEFPLAIRSQGCLRSKFSLL